MTAGRVPEGEFSFHDFERVAAAFVLEDKTWTLFLTWLMGRPRSPRLEAWLRSGPAVDAVREQFLLHGTRRCDGAEESR